MAGFLEYTEQNPIEEPIQAQESIKETARTVKERQEIKDKAEYYKDSIAEQLNGGNDPQYILYTAISCIGLLTDDEEWMEAQKEVLNRVYDDLEQENIFVDSAVVAAKRLQEMRDNYIDKLSKRLLKDCNDLRKIDAKMQEALDTVQTIYHIDFDRKKRE